jgi:hypothetical protein
MRFSLVTLACLFLSVFVSACSPRSTPTKSAKVPADFLFELERTACYGRCPTFKLRLDAKGVLAWEGIRFVKTVGKTERQLTPEELTQVYKLVTALKLTQYQDRYDDQKITDLPSIIIAVTEGGKRKRVEGRYGTPEALTKGISDIEQLLIADELKVTKPQPKN